MMLVRVCRVLLDVWPAVLAFFSGPKLWNTQRIISLRAQRQTITSERHFYPEALRQLDVSYMLAGATPRP